MSPITLDPNSQGGGEEEKDEFQERIENVNYDYDYPEDLNLKPGNDQHDKLLGMIMVRARESYNVMQRRHKDWRSIDKVLRAYVPADAEDEDEFPQIVIPQSYATLETLLTYMSAAFLQDPIMDYEGNGPEDALGARLLTRIIQQQNRKFNNSLALHTQWRDSFAYGVGSVSPVWERKMGFKTVVEETGFRSWVRKQFISTGEERRRSEWQLLFEGNKLENIDPYKMLPDPNVSAHEVQEGEFFGWIDPTNYMNLRSRERVDSDFIFNVQYLKHFTPRTSITADSHTSGRSRNEDAHEGTNPADIIWMYVDLIPAQWGLGSSEFPEKWLFGVAGDKVIISAMPLGLDHQKFPVTVAAPDYDGYSPHPVSRLGVIHDLQQLTDFLYTSHIANVKKVVNDMLVVDPSLVNIYDVNDPRAGKIIRMRRRAWGKGGIDEAIKQLNVQDVTQQHVGDSQIIGDIMRQVSGAQDNLQGRMQKRTTRMSASEFQGIRSSSLSRLEKDARVISAQSIMPLANLMASQTMQLMEEETYIKAVGDLEEQLKGVFDVEPELGRVKVNPLDLVVDYDVTAHDGSIPGSEDVETWVNLFQIMAQNEQIGQQFDMPRVFRHIAQQMGARNLEEFMRKAEEGPNPQVMEDEEVERQRDRGNIRPATNGEPQ